MTPKHWLMPREVAVMPADAPVTVSVLRQSLGSLEQHYGETVTLLSEVDESVKRLAAKGSSDYREIQQVQAQIRATQDQDRATMLASMGDLKADLVAMRDGDERSRREHGDLLREVTKKLDTVQDWTVKHEGWHDGVREGRHDTDQTRQVAAKAGEEAGASALRKLPWDKIITALVTAALTALGFGIGGCAHLTPAEKKLADIGVSAGQRCVVDVAVDACEWGAGATGYKVCLRNNAIPCLFEHAVSAAAVGLGILWERYGMRLEGAVTSTPNTALAPVAACMDAVDAEYVVKHCPAGKAPRLCVVDAVQWCAEHGADANLLESPKE